uniref:Uncharacterized protein n=1 Tax=Glossina palpalis gambiensis TaxID=67801 RepID=A0A1B0AN43_9MUSC
MCTTNPPTTHQALARKHSIQMPQVLYYKHQPAPIFKCEFETQQSKSMGPISFIACRSLKICSKVNTISESVEIADGADNDKLFTNTSYFPWLRLFALSKSMFSIEVFCEVGSMVEVDSGIVLVDVAFLSLSAAGVVFGGSINVFNNVTSLASSGVCVVSVSSLYAASVRSVLLSSLTVDVTAAFSFNFCVLRAISSKYLGASFLSMKSSKLDVRSIFSSEIIAVGVVTTFGSSCKDFCVSLLVTL